ncbi:YdcF family protein [Curtobacterium flaccumfaciens]|nr:YdcF family protein [Curtobacterium flaccumfaciens]
MDLRRARRAGDPGPPGLRPVRAAVPRGTSRWALSVSVLASIGGVFAGIFLWGEVVHARAARRSAGLPLPAPGTAGAVVVLGFGNHGARINAINRWRARIAVRTARGAVRRGCDVTIICAGGAVHGAVPESELLADYIAGALHWHGRVHTERTSASTWENVRNILPLLDGMEWVSFASNSLHAEKARLYLRRQRTTPGLRLAPAADYRPGEMLAVKPVFAAVGLWKLRAVLRST